MPAVKINPPKNTNIDLPNFIQALLINLGIKNKANNIPIPKGINTLKFKLEMLPIIVEYAPTDNKNALPDIPGKSRNEHAMKPIIIRKYKLNEKFS